MSMAGSLLHVGNSLLRLAGKLMTQSPSEKKVSGISGL